MDFVSSCRRKRLTLPVGPLGRLGQLVLGARLTLDQDTFRVKPSYHVRGIISSNLKASLNAFTFTFHLETIFFLYPVAFSSMMLLQVGFEIRQGGAELIPFNTVRLKPRISFGRIGLEVGHILKGPLQK